MIKLPLDLAKQIINYQQFHNLFGYFCEFGGGGSDKDFIIWEENNEHYLVHKSEIECSGIFVKLKKGE